MESNGGQLEITLLTFERLGFGYGKRVDWEGSERFRDNQL